MNWIWLSLFLVITGITLLLVAVDRLIRGVWRKVFVITMAIALVISLRMTFLDNDAAWLSYGKILRVHNELTWIQDAYIKNHIKEIERSSEKERQFFALGSSQVNQLFGADKTIFYMHLPALGVYGYSFFLSEIVSRHPRAVILYLSEFDMSRRYDDSCAGVVKSMPINTRYLFLLLGRYIDAGQTDWVKRFYKSCVVAYEASILEVKHGFLVRGILRRIIGIPDPDAKKESKKLQKEKSQRSTSGKRPSFKDISFDENNWLALEEFMAFLEKEKIGVIILEGAYSPDRMFLPEAVAANRLFRMRLLPIVARHQNAEFIPREQELTFTSDDYREGQWNHHKPEAARRYCEWLRSILYQRFDTDESR